MPEPTNEQQQQQNEPAGSQAQSEIGAKLAAAFPDGVLINQDGTAATPATGPAATGAAATGASGPAITGATGPASTGATGATGAATGSTGAATGATGAAQTGATGAAQTGATGAATGATGPDLELPTPSAIGKAIADAMKPAASGATGPSGAAASGATGASGTGATGAPDEDVEAKKRRDAAEKAMTVEAGTAFKEVRGENKTLRAELAEARKKIAAAEAKAGQTQTPADYEQLKQRVAEYEVKLAATNIAETEEFQKTIAAPIKATETELFELATARKIDEGDLRAALADPNPTARMDRLAELSEGLNRLETARFDRLVVELGQLHAKRDTTLAGAGDKWKELQATQRAEQERLNAELTESWTKALDSSYDSLSTELPIFKPTGDEAWDASMSEVRTRVKGMDISKLTNDQIASAFYKEGAFPLMLNLVAEQSGQIEELHKTISKLRGTAAPAGGGQTTQESASGPAPTTFQEAMKTSLDGVLPK